MIKTWQLVAVEPLESGECKENSGEWLKIVGKATDAALQMAGKVVNPYQSILSIRSTEAGLQRGPRKEGLLDHARKTVIGECGIAV